MHILGYIAVIFMGLVLGMLGAGGSILTVPILVYLFHYNALIATHNALIVVSTTAFIGALNYFRGGDVAGRIVVFFAGPSFLGIFLARRMVLPALPPVIFQQGDLLLTKETLVLVVFAILMILAAYSMIRGPSPKLLREAEQQTLSNLQNEEGKQSLLYLGVLGFMVGFLTGFVGASGGFMIIPAIIHFAKLPLRLAIGTSLSIVTVNTAFGFFTDLPHVPSPDWPFLLSLMLAAAFGIYTGVKIGRRIPERMLKKAFGWLVLAVGTFIISEQLLHL